MEVSGAEIGGKSEMCKCLNDTRLPLSGFPLVAHYIPRGLSGKLVLKTPDLTWVKG